MAAAATLFELDDQLVELMNEVEEATEAGDEVGAALASEIDRYLEAYRHRSTASPALALATVDRRHLRQRRPTASPRASEPPTTASRA